MDDTTFGILIVLFIILFGLALLYIIKFEFTKKHREADRVCNTNWSKTVYLYRLPITKEESLERLRLPSVQDELQYSFDPASLIITFFKHNASRTYQLVYLNFEGQLYLKLENKDTTFMNDRVYFGINLFCIEKLGAVPVPYYDTIPNL